LALDVFVVRVVDVNVDFDRDGNVNVASQR